MRFTPPENAAPGDDAFLAEVESCWTLLVGKLIRRDPIDSCIANARLKGVPPGNRASPWIIGYAGVNKSSPGHHEAAARRSVERAVFSWICRRRAEIPEETFRGFVDGLGLVHQWLLGLRVTGCPNGQCKIDRSLDARKAAGVYYTPPCVAQYIVERTLGQLLSAGNFGVLGRNMRAPCAHVSGSFWVAGAASKRILDPACGCGSFLLAAYRRLLQRYRPGSIDERREILDRHIFGMDIDRQAVSVARQSLWLEMIGGDGRDALREGPDQLSKNICTGDFLAETWPGKAGGPFDVLIGNPPYRRELGTKRLFDRLAASEFGRRHRTARMDLWYYFVHRGLELLAPNGTLSFIIPAYWTAGTGSAKLIDQLKNRTRVDEIFLLDDLPVFPGVSGRHMILRVTKTDRRQPTTIKRAARPGESDVAALLRGDVPVAVFRKTPEQLFRDGQIDLNPPSDDLLEKLAEWTPLGQLGKVRQGIAENPAAVNRRTNAKHGNRWRVGEGVFALRPDEVERLNLSEGEKRLLRPYHDLADLGRYRLAAEASRVLIYSTRETCPAIEEYPLLEAHLSRFRPIMEARRETRRGARAWWQLHWPRDEALWRSPKLIALQMAARPAFVPAGRAAYVPFSANVFVPSDSAGEHLNYFAALLNSRLMWRWYEHRAKRRGVGLEINGHVLARTPIRTIDFSLPVERRAHDRLVELVDSMLALRARPADGDLREIEPLDRRIDRLVCELYGVSDQLLRTV